MSDDLQERPPTSQLALAALICGLLICIPFLGLLGILLGGLALGRIRRSDGRLGGRRIALWGMGIGSAALVIWVMGLDRFQLYYLGEVHQRMTSSIQRVVESAIDGEPGKVRSEWGSTATMLDDARIQAFGEAIETNWGDLVGVSLLRSTATGGLLEPGMTASFEFQFERSNRTGTAVFDLITQGNTSLFPRPMLQELEIIDPGNPTLRLGAPLPSGTEAQEQ